MPIEPVKIPQNVYIEDRIVGPLTLRQIIMIAVGGGFSYALYASIAKSYGPPNLIVTVLVWLPAILSAIFALVSPLSPRKIGKPFTSCGSEWT